MKIDPQQISIVDPSLLTVHPVASQLPELADDDPNFIALLEDIRANGLRAPVDINSQNQILDGRHRWRCCKRLKFPAITAIVRSDEEAIGIVLTALHLRRHYTKGALAYSACLLLDAVEKGGARRALKPSLALQAKALGISERLYDQAIQVHKIFSNDQEFRDLQLPKLLAGDTCLGYIIAGHAGREATNGKAKNTANKLDLFARTFTELTIRSEYWTKLDQEEKQEADHAIAGAFEKLPLDLLALINKRAAGEIKHRKQEAV